MTVTTTDPMTEASAPARFADERTGLSTTFSAMARSTASRGLVGRFEEGAAVFAFVVRGGRVTQIDVVANPEKLRRLPPTGS